MLSDNGGSTINSDGKWPGGLCGLGGWASPSVCICVYVYGQELRRGRTVPVSKLLLIISLITNQFANRTGTQGLDISPSCTGLAQQFTNTQIYTHACTHSLLSQAASAERPRHKSVCLLLSTPAIMRHKRFVPRSL